MAEWIDGPKLVAWLVERKIWTDGVESTHSHLVRRWRNWREPGAVANVYTVDSHLTALGYHLHEVPEEFYCDRPKRMRNLDPAEQRDIVKSLDAGVSPQVIAERYGKSADTIRKYRGKAGDRWRQH